MINTIAAEDLQLLSEMIKWYRLQQPRKPERFRPETDHQASQCYVAYAEFGIPALSSSIPGNEYCTIWQITDDVSGTTNPVLLQIGNEQTTERVFNLSGTAIEADSWIPIIRDKFGRWLVAGGAGGTTSGGGSDFQTTTNLFELGASSSQAIGAEANVTVFDEDTNAWISNSGGVFTFTHTGTIRVHIHWSLPIVYSGSGGGITIELQKGSVGYTRVPILSTVHSNIGSSAFGMSYNINASGTVFVANGDNIRLRASSLSGASITTGVSPNGGICFDSLDPIA